MVKVRDFDVTDSTKKCCTCKQDKPFEYFSKNSSRKDGLQARCKTCVSDDYKKNRNKVLEQAKQYKILNPEKVKESQRRYRVSYPERVAKQKHDAYIKRRSYYLGRSQAYYIANSKKITEINKEWVKANSLAVHRIKSQYKHRRRMLESENGIYVVTQYDLCRMLYRANNACVYCKKPFGLYRKVTWDHIIPVSRGGTYSVGNLAPCCGPCNSSKQNKTIMEWRLYLLKR